MNVIEAGGILYKWFSENDSFSVEKDFMKVVPITDEPNRDRAAMLIALGDLREAQIVSNSTVGEEEYWILKRPYESYEQTVTITPDIALTISLMINRFCEIIGDNAEACDPTNIRAEDIKNLIYISNIMMDKKKNIDPDEEE